MEKELKCKRCGYVWLYKGNSDWYTSCPRCKTNVKTKGEKGNDGNGKRSKASSTKAV